MSGSGWSGGSRSSETTPCENLKFKTNIASPKPAALSLTIGDILQVELQNESLVLIYRGSLVGGIACKESRRLSYCISIGNTYEASVINTNGASINISVYPV